MDIRSTLEQVYTNYFNLLVSIGFEYKLDKKTIEDMIQNAFIKAFTSKDLIKSDTETGIRNFVIRIFRNECIDHLRKNKKLLEKMNPHLNPGIEMRTGDKRYDALNELLLIEELKLRKRAIKKIQPEKYQQPVLLYFEGYEPKEIAEKLDLNRNTTRSLLQRGLIKFENIMTKMDPLRKN